MILLDLVGSTPQGLAGSDKELREYHRQRIEHVTECARKHGIERLDDQGDLDLLFLPGDRPQPLLELFHDLNGRNPVPPYLHFRPVLRMVAHYNRFAFSPRDAQGLRKQLSSNHLTLQFRFEKACPERALLMTRPLYELVRDYVPTDWLRCNKPVPQKLAEWLKITGDEIYWLGLPGDDLQTKVEATYAKLRDESQAPKPVAPAERETKSESEPATPPPGKRARGPSRARLPVFFWGVVALLLLAGVGLWYWDAFQRQHIEYYANVIKRWGLPEGVGPLTDEQVRHRNVTLAFIKRGRRGVVQEIRAVNGRGAYPHFGSLPPFSLLDLNPLAGEVAELMALCRVTFTRNANGQVLMQSAYNRSDRPLYTLHYAQPGIAEYKEGAFSKPSRTGITHIKFMQPETGAEAGLDKELLYFDSTGTPKADDNGSFGARSTFNALGVPVEFTNLGADGQPAVDRVGMAKITRTNDGQGNLMQEVNLGPHNQLVLGSDGRSEMKMRYDQHGNITEAAFFGTEGQLVTSKELGAAGRTFAYDDHGNIVEHTFFGPDRQLVVGVLLGVAKLTIVWDEKGRSLETPFGPDGKPMLISGRAVKVRGVWDERGYLVEAAKFDEDDRPIRGDDGCAKRSFTHDKHGNVTETACFDEGGEPVRDNEGVARVKSIYDERGNRVEENYFGPDGRPGHYEAQYVKTRFKYDPQGNKVEETYFDAAERPVRTKDAYAKVTYGYDLQGKLVKVLFFDEMGRPTERKGGYAGSGRVFDERGNMIEESFFDTEGKPSRTEQGYFKGKYVYDERGYQIEVAFYDQRDRLILHEDGYAKVRDKYNDKGQRIELSFFGIEDSPVASKKYGTATVRRTYNASGRLSQIDYFNTGDLLARNANGYATTGFSYDDLGRETKREFYDVGGARVVTRVTIDKVENDSKSHRVGLQVGDVLLSYDGGEVANKHLFEELELVKGERPRELTVQRDDGRVLSLHVPAGRLTGIETVDKVPADLGRASAPTRPP